MLTVDEQRVLEAIEPDSLTPASTVAKSLRMKVSSVHRIIQRLREHNILLGRTAVVDLSRLGLAEYGFRLQIVFQTEAHMLAFESSVIRNKAISWVASVGGTYNYDLSIVASAPREALDIFESAAASFKGIIMRQEMNIRIERFRFWRDKPARGERAYFHIGHRSLTKPLTTSEAMVLTALNTGGISSLRECAARIGMAHSSFIQSIHNLRRREILIGLPYRYDRAKAGIAQHRIYIRTRMRSRAVTDRLLNAVRKQSNVVLLVTTIGSFDFELACDLPIGESPQAITMSITSALGEDLLTLENAPVFRQIKLIQFPAG